MNQQQTQEATTSHIIDTRGIPGELILYTPIQAARILGCTETWLLTQLRQRKLPGHKIGRKWRLTKEDIQHAIQITAQPAVNAPSNIMNSLTGNSLRKLHRNTRLTL